ncbi:HEAT repeat domain-containing protein [Myxococcus sp. SDU36]|uniref:HEAT repeat domain-containing protein n=1 Tax=Myxococcus sp. SDU36 TaxID=2831967 RepID=UPI00254362E2|nr:HEAT repeat domain-containing protein [Myxococcus sp. SDU36]
MKSLVLLLAVLTAATLWRAGTATRTPAPPETPLAVSQSLDDDAPPLEPEENLPGVKGRERVLVVGHRLRYTFELDLRTHTEHPPGTRASLHTGWSGLLELTYLGAEGAQHLFSGRLVPTRLVVNAGETPAAGDAALRALRGRFERPVYVGQDVRGRVMAVHFDAAQDAAARRLVRLLLASTQFVAEEGARWSTEEPDSRGDLEAVYRAGGSANTYVKTKRRYLRAGSAVLPRLQGHLDFTLFADGHVREATGSEVVELGGGGTGLPRIREETRVALTNVGVDYRLSSLRPFESTRATLRSERLTELAGMEGAKLGARALLLGEELERVLDGARDAGVRNAAALSMGTLAKALEVPEPGRSQVLVEGLLRRCRAGTLEPEVCLDALARAGAPAGLAYVKSSLAHPDTDVRGAATEALSAIPGAAVDALLDQVMLGDPSSRVRTLAVKAVSQRVAGAHLEALARVLRAERSERVRIEVVRLLGHLRTVEPPTVALLRDVAANDGSANVRALAASLLDE